MERKQTSSLYKANEQSGAIYLMSSNMYPHRVGCVQSVYPRAAVILNHLLAAVV